MSVRIPSTPVDITTPESTDPRAEFFSRLAYLTVFSQLHLEALSSLVRVYTLRAPAPTRTNRPLAEFWRPEAG